jgi:hypothetical protein
MEISFFALPSKHGPVQGRFKPAHDSAEPFGLELMAERLVAGLPISLSTKVAACVRRFETATPLNDGRTESKKDISMLTRAFLSCITLKRSAGVLG